MQLKDKKVLVTGAGGFIGSHLTERLVEEGCKVNAFARYNSKNSWGWLEESEHKDDIEICLGDIRDYDSVKNAMKGIDVVFHLAALIGIPYSGIKQIPVVNNSGEVIDLILWKDIISFVFPRKEKDSYVFIPAGGKGVRLDPFTKILPKPLIPLGDKPIIETIIEKFLQYGFSKFIISLNYKGDMIKSYFAENHHDFKIEYVKEDKELGTAGCLSLIKGKIHNSLVISNCDVMTDLDFDELLEFHKEKTLHATIVGVVRHVKIPYGVLEIDEGMLSKIAEKPEYDFIVNPGIYVIEPDIIDIVRDNSHLNMPDLLSMAKNKGFRVGVYTFSGEWIDIGQWEEYRRAIEHIKIWGGSLDTLK